MAHPGALLRTIRRPVFTITIPENFAIDLLHKKVRRSKSPTKVLKTAGKFVPSARSCAGHGGIIGKQGLSRLERSGAPRKGRRRRRPGLDAVLHTHATFQKSPATLVPFCVCASSNNDDDSFSLFLTTQKRPRERKEMEEKKHARWGHLELTFALATTI